MPYGVGRDAGGSSGVGPISQQDILALLQELTGGLAGGGGPSPSPAQAIQTFRQQPMPTDFPGLGFNTGGVQTPSRGGSSPFSVTPGGQQMFDDAKSVINGDLVNQLAQTLNNPNALAATTPVADEQSERDKMISMLMDVIGSGGAPSVDIEAAMGETQSALDQLYGAQIGAIKGQNRAAKADTREGSAQINAMYRALGEDYRKAGKRERKLTNKMTRRVEGLGKRSNDRLGQDAQDTLSANAAGAAGLGSADLLAELNSSVNDQVTRVQGAGERETARNATRTFREGQSNARFLDDMGMVSQAEGTNRAADLFGDLQDYLQGNRSQIAGLRGEKAMALADARNGLTQSVAASQGDYQQDLFENLLKVAGMNLDYMNAETAASAAGSEGGFDPMSLLPEGAARSMNLIQAMSGSPVAAQQNTDLLNQLLQSPELIAGELQFENGQTASIDNLATLKKLVQDQIGTSVPPQQMDTILYALANYLNVGQ